MSPLSTVAMNVASMQQQQQQPQLRQRAFSLGQQHAQPTMQQIRDTIAAAGLLGLARRILTCFLETPVTTVHIILSKHGKYEMRKNDTSS